ncbi:MAG TPA: hypothetical protein VGO37_07835 [Steroidobacteraceae bacterium]|jgi:hypothetical protein|nr:hypothetical protein [Steroidobacteraceae bacterium]
MADDASFLLPVVIDAPPDATARVPDRLRQLQWSRLPSGETSPAFVERVSSLLTPDASSASPQFRQSAGIGPAIQAEACGFTEVASSSSDYRGSRDDRGRLPGGG